MDASTPLPVNLIPLGLPMVGGGGQGGATRT